MTATKSISSETTSSRRPRSVGAIVVGVYTAGWAGLFALVGLMQFWRFHLHAYDLGIFAQGTWLLSQFKDPFVTIRGLELFADHSSYILLLVAPIYWVFPTASTLIVLTVLAMAATAPLTYVVARRAGAGELLATVTGVLVLVQPAVQWQVRDGFHPEVLVVPLAVAAVALIQRDRNAWAIAAVVLALTAKEDAALLIVPLGIAVALWMGRRRLGAIIAGLGAGAFLLNFLVLLPAWSPTGEVLYSYRYERLGDTPVGVILALLTTPSAWIEVITSVPRIEYVAVLILAMPLALISPRWLLLGTPTLIANLFSNHGYQYEIEYHYTAYLIVAVVLAAAFGAAKVQGWRHRGPRVTAIVVAVVVAIGVWVAAGPTSGWAKQHEHQTQIRQIIEVIPADESVSTWTTLVPSLANRELVYLFPNPWEHHDYGAEGVSDADPATIEWVFVRMDSYRHFDEIIERLLASEEFEVAVDDPPFLLLHRR